MVDLALRIHNKIYTAPVILLAKEVANLSEEEIIKQVQKPEIKEKTIELIKKKKVIKKKRIEIITAEAMQRKVKR